MISREAVEQLKADIRLNVDSYDQATYGDTSECGTIMCLAGFCRLREIGKDAYQRELAGAIEGNESYNAFADECIASGIRVLGITRDVDPQLFLMAVAWPDDLRIAYYATGSKCKRVEIACQALDRLQDDGSISELLAAPTPVVQEGTK